MLHKHVFVLWGSLDQQRRALASIRDSLTPDGMLWLDVYVPKPNPAAAEPYLTTHLDKKAGMLLLYGAQTREDHFEERSLVNAFTIVLRKGERPEVYVQSWRYAWLHPNELRLLLESTGFELVQLLGDYDGGAADEISVQMIALARRT